MPIAETIGRKIAELELGGPRSVPGDLESVPDDLVRSGFRIEFGLNSV